MFYLVALYSNVPLLFLSSPRGVISSFGELNTHQAPLKPTNNTKTQNDFSTFTQKLKLRKKMEFKMDLVHKIENFEDRSFDTTTSECSNRTPSIESWENNSGK